MHEHVRFGSKADMCIAKGHIRFTPESGRGLAPAAVSILYQLTSCACSITEQPVRRNDNGCRELAKRRQPRPRKSPSWRLAGLLLKPLHGAQIR